VPYLPHLALGAAALAIGLTAPGTPTARSRPDSLTSAGRRWPPAALRTREFWLGVALPAPFVFGTISLAIVVLPEEVTSARTLSAGYAGLMTILAFATGIGVQPVARRLAARRPAIGISAGLSAAAAGTAVGVAAVAGPSQLLAGLAAAFLGLAYGLCLVCGLHHAEQLAGPRDRGTVLAAYYVLAYLGFAAPYAVDGLNAAVGKPVTFAVLAGVAAVLAGLMWARAARSAPLHTPVDTERRRLTPTPAP
jgi:hypothetical protein